MMMTSRSGMRFDREKIRREEPQKFNWNVVFFSACALNIGAMLGLIICSIGRVI